MLSPEEKQEFFCDPKEINWEKYLDVFMQGIMIYTLKEDKIAPEYKFENVLMKNFPRYRHSREAFAERKNFREKDISIYEQQILNEDRYNRFFKVNKAMLEKNQAYKKTYGFDRQAVENELVRIRSSLSQRWSQVYYYVFAKMLFKVTEALYV